MGDPARAGSRATVVVDPAGQEVSTKCEWSPL
jgi:hypothetical protein